MCCYSSFKYNTLCHGLLYSHTYMYEHPLPPHSFLPSLPPSLLPYPTLSFSFPPSLLPSLISPTLNTLPSSISSHIIHPTHLLYCQESPASPRQHCPSSHTPHVSSLDTAKDREMLNQSKQVSSQPSSPTYHPTAGHLTLHSSRCGGHQPPTLAPSLGNSPPAAEVGVQSHREWVGSN